MPGVGQPFRLRSRSEMNSSNAEVQSIRLVADSWTADVHTGNIEQLGELMTDDIVVIHRNGRTVSEKSAVMEDFAHSLRTFSIQQTVESEEIIVAGEWAFDRANVHTAICSREGRDAKHFDSNSVTILRKESGGWCVARAIGAIVQQR